MNKEELYIFTDEGREQLDLPSPSGITLKWVSNIFNDISKLTCCYSYTFKLPMTSKNRRVLDNVDDIRHNSTINRVSVKAEFYVNGVCLCPNANLYISEVGTTSFSCVMTWRSLDAFGALKKNSVKLNELPSVGTFVWKTGDDSLVYGYPSLNQKNTDNILYPNYDAGVPYENGTPPKPVVPVYRLIQLINEFYGVKFVLGREISDGMGLLPVSCFNNKRYYGDFVYDDFISYGVLPITGIGVSSGTQNKFTVSNIEGAEETFGIRVGSDVSDVVYEKWVVTGTNMGATDSTKILSQETIDAEGYTRYRGIETISFAGNKYIVQSGVNGSTRQESLTEETSRYVREQGHGHDSGGMHFWTHWRIYECTGKRKLKYFPTKGSFIKMFSCKIECTLRGEAEVRISKQDITDGKAELKDYWWIYLLKAKQSNDEEGSIDVYSDESDEWMGLRSISREETDTEWIYKFDFGVQYDVRKLEIDAADDDEIGLCFWTGMIEEGWSTKDSDGNVTATGTKISKASRFSRLYVKSITPNVHFDGIPAEMDIISNLPDISCFEFIKSVFYMNGALPRVEKDGVTISAMYYNQLRDRISTGDVIDWSSKMLGHDNENPSSIKTYNSSFGQENYLQMAYSEKEKTEEELLAEVDIYGKGYGVFTIDDIRLDVDKVVFTSCFYPGLKRDLAYPNLLVGDTIKVWDGEKNIQSSVNPLYGYVNYRALNPTFEDVSNISSRPMLSSSGVDFKHIRMDAFEPFNDIDSFYGYMKSILRNYAMVKEKLLLNEYDLLNFDESIPVYLKKYNLYFAVSTIQRSKDGICTVELVRLPYELGVYETPEGTDIDKIRYSNSLKSYLISFKLDLERDYTSNRCPIEFETFNNNQYGIGHTTYNTLKIPGDFEAMNKDYVSRFVFPYEAESLKGDSYSISFTIPKEVTYNITKMRGYDVLYSKDFKSKLRVYYDDVLCEQGTRTLVFTKNDFGTYHVFKFIYNIYNDEGEKIEQIRKKMYYFVSGLNRNVITDDFGDTHEEDDPDFRPFAEIHSGELYANGSIDLKVNGEAVRIMQETGGETSIGYSSSFKMFNSDKAAPYSHDVNSWDSDTYSLRVDVINNIKLEKHITPVSSEIIDGVAEYKLYIDNEVVMENDFSSTSVVATFSKSNAGEVHEIRLEYTIKDDAGNVVMEKTMTQKYCVLGFGEITETSTSTLLFGFAIDLKDIGKALANTRYKKDGVIKVNSTQTLGGGRRLIIEEGVTDVGPNLVVSSWYSNTYSLFSVDESGTGSFKVKVVYLKKQGEVTIKTWEKTVNARVYWDGSLVNSLSEPMTKNGYADEQHSLKLEWDVPNEDGTIAETKSLTVTYHSTSYFN